MTKNKEVVFYSKEAYMLSHLYKVKYTYMIASFYPEAQLPMCTMYTHTHTQSKLEFRKNNRFNSHRGPQWQMQFSDW